jgi:hypothetical protein
MPATAQIKMDMNKITCKDFLGYNSENQVFVQYWMSGYFNAAANSDVLDLKRLQGNTAKVMAYCKKTSLTRYRPQSRKASAKCILAPLAWRYARPWPLRSLTT